MNEKENVISMNYVFGCEQCRWDANHREEHFAFLSRMERVIRDLAATAINSESTRRFHPSFGVTKTKIRAEYERMEGSVGMYMVLTGQAMHAGIPSLAKFNDEKTAEVVSRCRKVVGSL